MRRLASAVLLAAFVVALVAGCSQSEPTEGAAQAPGDTGARESTGETEVLATTSGGPSDSGATVGVASTIERSEAAATSESAESQGPAARSRPAVAQEPPFVASPRASGGAGYGADGVLGVRYGIHEGYERVVVDLGTGEQPAWSVPEWKLDTPTGDGTLRVTFPSVSATAVSGGSFGGPLLKSFYVVRAPEDGMFVDIFSESAFTYRVMELSNPARLVVDFKPSSASLDFPLPAAAANTVLTQPRRGARVEGSLMVSGYSRNPEAHNTIVLTAGGRTLARETVVSNDWTSTWGYFETTLDVPSFSGEGTLKVGAQSARDGSFEGVEIPVYGSG